MEAIAEHDSRPKWFIGMVCTKEFGIFIFYVAISLLFNPFKKVWFQKDTWHLIDGLVAALLLLTILYDLTRKKQ